MIKNLYKTNKSMKLLYKMVNYILDKNLENHNKFQVLIY